MAKEESKQTSAGPRVCIYCSEIEAGKLRALKNAAAGTRALSMSAFVLEHFEIREAPEPKSE